MKIIHISDLHFPTPLPFLSLKGKMIAGYANFTLRRMNKYPVTVRDALINFIKKSSYDVLVISGDLVNVGHELEFKNVKKLLAPILDERTFMIPGNHDRYTQNSIKPNDLFIKYFGEFCGENILENEYLRVKKFNNIPFIGWDSNKPRTLFNAYGEIADIVIQKSLNYIKKEKSSKYFLVCHHPLWNPGGYEESNHHKMHDREMIIHKLKDHPPVMVFHGHSHINWVRNANTEIPFWIVNSASSSRLCDDTHPTGFHSIEMKQSKIEIKRLSFSVKQGDFIESELLGYDD